MVTERGKRFAVILALAALAGVAGCARFPSSYTRVTLKATPQRGQKVTRADMDAAAQVVRKRTDALGVEAVIERKGRDQIVVELPDIKRMERALALLQKTGALEFWYMKDVGSGRPEERNRFPRFRMEVSETDEYSFRDVNDPTAPPIKSPSDIRRIVIGENATPEFTGRDLQPKTSACFDSQNRPIIQLVFTKDAQRRFTDFTRLHVREYLAVTLDGKILTVPLIQSAIVGNPVITGSSDMEDAQELADLLNAGALPVPLQAVEVRRIGPNR